MACRQDQGIQELQIATVTEPVSTEASSARAFGRKQVIVTLAVLLPVLYALVVNYSALDNPPAWDSATTVSPAALTIVENEFDIWAVAQMPGTLEGGPSTHATSIYTIGLAALIGLLGASNGFLVAHILSIAMIGGLAAATYILGRERLTVGMSALVAATVSVLPIVVQQSADIYLDLPLAIITTLAVWTTVRRWFWPTVGLVFLGVALKTAGVLLLPLLLLAGPKGQSWMKRLLYAGVGGLVGLLPFIPAYLTTDRFDTQVTSEVRMSLLQSSMSMLILSIDVFLILVVALFAAYGRARGKRLDRVSQVTAMLVLGFIAAYFGTSMLSGTIAVLPRYYIVVLPAVLVTIPPSRYEAEGPRSAKSLAAVGLLVFLVVASVVNRSGDYYPIPDHPFFVLAERSTRAQDLLALQVEGTQRLVETGLPVVIALQEHFRLTYPEMGYVDQTPEVRFNLLEAWPDELPDSFAMLVERRFANPVVAFEERLLEENEFDLEYEPLQVLGFESDLVIATRK